MTDKWDHLPNAKLIDWVLTDLKANPGKWDVMHYSVWNSVWSSEQEEAAWNSVWTAMCDIGRNVAYDSAWNAVWIEGRASPWQMARAPGWSAIAAFIVYDNCPEYLDMTPGELQVWGELSGHPACILLLPLIIRKQKMQEFKKS